MIAKFKYYKIFFTISGLTEVEQYNTTKKSLIDFIKSKDSDAEILYCKFYNNKNTFIGCGDLTVDKINTLTRMISKDSEYKNFSFDTFNGVFFKYNTEKNINK